MTRQRRTARTVPPVKGARAALESHLRFAAEMRPYTYVVVAGPPRETPGTVVTIHEHPDHHEARAYKPRGAVR